MSNTSVVVLTAADADILMKPYPPANGINPIGWPSIYPKVQAIASGRVVCVEAERLRRMEAALEFYASFGQGETEVVSGKRAREALTPPIVAIAPEDKP